jgi:hypothetical protein
MSVVKTRYENTCNVTQVASKRVAVAEILEFKERDRLNVILNKSVKMSMVWNGQMYEGRMAGMDFISDGPKGQKYTEGR